MALKIINRLSNVINDIELVVARILTHGFPPGPMGALACDLDANWQQPAKPATKPFSLKDIFGDGLLWAVPKTRRPLEKRMSRRFGDPERYYKMLRPKTNIIMCTKCGYNHEASRLCSNCYARVAEETKELQKFIVYDLGLQPVEKDVIVLYENEQVNTNEKFWKDQRIVEIPKPRPAWFDSNLSQSSTQEPSESKEVKPNELA